MINHKVPENHQDMKFWPNLNSFIGKWKITLFLDDPVVTSRQKGFEVPMP